MYFHNLFWGNETDDVLDKWGTERLELGIGVNLESKVGVTSVRPGTHQTFVRPMRGWRLGHVDDAGADRVV